MSLRHFSSSFVLSCFICSGAAAQPDEAGKTDSKASPKRAPDMMAVLGMRAPELKFDGPAPLKAVLEVLNKRLRSVGATITIDDDAFNRASDGAPISLGNVEIESSIYPRPFLTVRDYLQMLIRQLPLPEHYHPTLAVRPGVIELTTRDAVDPAKILVHAEFTKVSLEEALERLAEEHGASYVIDTRVADKARLPVSGRFRSGPSLATVVRVLADSAGLKALILDGVIYVTARDNTLEIPDPRKADAGR